MNNVFYVFEGAETTYAAFSLRVANQARALPECRGDVVGLLIGHGPDFVINLFALWKAGAVPFLVSTRVPWDMAADLMDAAGARLLVTDKVDSIPTNEGRPSLHVFSAAGERENARDPDDTTAPEPPDIGPVILHTSGTTRSPKLVRFSSTSLLASLSFEEAAWDGLWTRRDASLGWLPLYHAFGLMSELLYAYRLKSRYYFSEANPRALLAKLEQEPITLFSSVPWMLEQISCLPGGLAALARLRWVVAGGAVTGPDLGQKLVAAGVRLIQQYGMTELGATLRGDPGGDWRDLFPVIPSEYWSLEDGTGELIVQPDCPIFGELATRDIFDRASSGALRYRNRVDDVLVHINGEKSNALAIERMVLARAGAAIDQFVVAGSGRRRPACLVLWKHEPPTAEDRDALRRAIDEANKELPRQSQLHHELVLPLAPSERVRIPLSPKGTVIRTAVEELFRNDLDQLYQYAEALKSIPRNPALLERLRGLAPAAARSELRAFVCSIAARVLGLEADQAVDPDIGFAEQGMDSLMDVRIRASLQAALGVDLPTTLVSDAPTVDRLTERLASDVPGTFAYGRASSGRNVLRREFRRVPRSVRNNESFDLNGCVAIVTGGSRGLGRVYACALASAGAAVAVTGRSASQVRETVQLIEAAGGRAIPASFDVADPAAVEHAVKEIQAQLGTVNVLVNNAGVGGPIGYSWDVDPNSWWRTLEIHVRGTFLCSRAVLPGMIRGGGGRIINIASHAGVFRFPTASAYSVAKAAVIKLTENQAVELKRQNIYVFAFHPGLVDGGMTHAALAADAPVDLPAHLATRWVREQHEAGNTVPPELAVESILFLACGGADALSGRYLTVFDDLASLTAQAETIRRNDLLTLRVRQAAG